MATKFLDGAFSMVAFEIQDLRDLAKAIDGVMPELEIAVFDGDMDSDLLDDLVESREMLQEALED